MVKNAVGWVKQHWRRMVVYGLVGCVVLLVLVQLLYPSDRLPLFLTIDTQSVSAMKKDDAIKQLDTAYAKKKLMVYTTNQTKPSLQPVAGDIGLTTKTAQQVGRVSYPWYLRLVPSSLFWVYATQQPEAPAYSLNQEKLEVYVTKTFGEQCRVEPTNPTVTASESELKVTPASDGGVCKKDEVLAAFKAVQPRLSGETSVKLTVEPLKPVLSTKAVEDIVKTIEAQLKKGVSVEVGGEQIALEAKTVRAWVVVDTTGEEVVVSLDGQKANDTLGEKFGTKLYRAAGVTKVTTHDFTETARQNGAPGQALDAPATLSSMTEYLLAKTDQPKAVARVVEPRVEFTRTYSSTDVGLSALLKNYADDKPGTYGVSLIELSGKRRRAGFDDTKQFTTASTYKVFVAYSTLKRIDSGQFRWTDQISGGRNLEKCFDDMIVRSDNPCSEALIEKIGRRALTSEAAEAGASQTTFLNAAGNKTTAKDLSTVMAALESGQLSISSSSRERFLGALKRNIYRQGIPAGASGTVANKVGFLEGLLHDTVIVYSPSGTYVLTILTDGSSWANIAELTRQIEALR